MSSSIFADPPGVEAVEARLTKAKPYLGIPTSNLTLLCPFVIILFIVLPLWSLTVLPIFILYSIFVLSPRFFFASRKKKDLSKEEAVSPCEGIPKWEEREFDVVVYGVTGHSGLLLAEYLVMQYLVGKREPSLKIALAGRNEKKLEAARAKLAENSDPLALSLPLVVADSGNDDSLERMCKRTKVVGTTVGPFLKYGEGLARACARTGTGYCDLTGEIAFAKIVNAKYDDVAKQTGARVVSFTGFDSVPSDVGTMALARKFSAKFEGKSPRYVDLVVKKVNGEAQGGTIDTVVHLVENGPPPRLTGLPAKENGKKKGGVEAKTPLVYWNKLAGDWTIPFFMAPVNSKVVAITNRSTGMFEKMTYNECQAMPTILSWMVGGLGLMMGGSLFLMGPTRSLMFRFGLLPKPGQGPTREKMRKGFTQSILIASDDEGNVETLTWNALGDPGGFATAVYQGECCMALVNGMARKGSDDVAGAGLTVGASIGDEAMLERLRATGFFSIH